MSNFNRGQRCWRYWYLIWHVWRVNITEVSLHLALWQIEGVLNVSTIFFRQWLETDN